MATFRELLVGLGGFKVVEPVTDLAFSIALQKAFNEEDSPHGRPWHVSFHASSFPGDEQACPRYAQYHLLDAVKEMPNRWLHGVADVGKAIELTVVRANREAGYLARSNQPGRSSDPDALDSDNLPMPQMGFVEPDTWLTGSVDMPLVPFGYTSVFPVEIKTKHESKIAEMREGERSYDSKHRKQLLCSLGLAHDHGANDFLHPTEDRVLDQAVDGAIYYLPRDSEWPGPQETAEFYFSYDPEFMEQGRAQLREFRAAFIEGELPVRVPRKSSLSHPLGWKWSEGLCKYCSVKKACKSDYANGVVHSIDSGAVAAARFTRPGYDPHKKRAAVFSMWDMPDPLAP